MGWEVHGRIPDARYLGNRVRSAKGLRKLIRGYFGFPKVRVLQFTPAWMDIPVHTRLGSSATVLGTSSRLGDRMEDVLSRFTVQIGPLPRAWFNRFLPSSKALVAQYAKGGHAADDGEVSSSLLRAVKDLVDIYVRDPLDYQVQVLLDPEPGKPPALEARLPRIASLFPFP